MSPRWRSVSPLRRSVSMSPRWLSVSPLCRSALGDPTVIVSLPEAHISSVSGVRAPLPGELFSAYLRGWFRVSPRFTFLDPPLRVLRSLISGVIYRVQALLTGCRLWYLSVFASCVAIFFLWVSFTALPVVRGASIPPVRSVSPLHLLEFQQELAGHPDHARVRYVLDGIRLGFSTGFDPSLVTLRSSRRNMKSALDHPEVIDAYLANEISKNRMAGPFAAPPFPHLHCSPFGVIPKKGQPGKWRLILDLSSPGLHSVNAGIPQEPYSLRYISVDSAISLLMELGPGAVMAKFDIECAYRNIPIRLEDRYLLGMSWRDQFFVDLPFGLRSAPYIFNSVADMVEWILTTNYHIRFLMHYLDDFLTLAPARSSECAVNVATARSVFTRLGLPLHPDKCEGPTTSLVFLGIELDSVTQTARLPQIKLAATLKLLHRWAAKRWCTRKELESLIGSLQHVCKVVPPGRSFLRRMIDLLCAFRSPHHPIRLNLEFRRDLAWWLDFLRSWNGVSFFRMPSVSSLPDLYLASDAAGAIGFGAVWRNAWFAGSWPSSAPSTNITALELFPIVVAAHLWGNQWQRLKVEFLCDNQAVVAILNSGSSRDKLSMHLMRRLILACQFHFSVSARHVPGHRNGAADALSRSQFQVFHRLHPSADLFPTPVPSTLVSELLSVN